ncbi:MAG: PD40 domain-containing protein [Bdellovibrionales bacterium]|nr:PD40 domain-containing protein [Bdellovibrionales bacterium]
MIALLLSLLFSVPAAHAQNFIDLIGLSPYTKYKTFETEHFNFIYQEGYFAFSERAAVHLEHAHEVLSPILKWEPRGKTNILVVDNSDSANGLTMPPLRVGIVLIATPPDAWYATSYSDDWIKLLVFHEYTHMLNIDATSNWMEALRILFGDVIRPNGLWPTWMLEGLAVYYETRTSHMGRGRSPYYDAVLRAFLQDNKLDNAENFGMTLDRVNGNPPMFPGGEIAYLFGYEMWQQMANNYPDRSKAESDMGELSYHSSHRIPFFINGNQENVTGKDWYEVWDDFVKASKTRLTAQIDQIKKSPTSVFEPVTDADYSAVGGAISPDGKWLAYTKSSTVRRTGLYLKDLSTGKEVRANDKNEGVGLAFTNDSKKLIYSSIERFNTYQSFSDLFAYDLASGSNTRLSHGMRAKDPTISPDGSTVAFIKVQHGTHTLWSAALGKRNGDFAIGNLKVIYRPKDFSILGTPKYLNANRIVFSEQSLGQAQSDIRVLNVKTNEVLTLWTDHSMNRSVAVNRGTVLFVSNRGGVDNLYELADVQGVKSVNRVSNVVTGLALPFVAPNGALWASALTSVGYQIGKLQRLPAIPPSASATAVDIRPNAPEPLAEAVAEPKSLNLTESQATEYSPWSSLLPRQWAPIAFFDYSSYAGAEIGSSILGFDSTGHHQYAALAAYHFKTATVDPYLGYTYYGFRPVINLSGSSSTADIASDPAGSFYKRSNEASIEFSFPVRWTFSSLTPSLYVGANWNSIRDLATGDRVGSPEPDYNRSRVPFFGLGVSFQSLEQSRLGFMPERGEQFSIATEGRKYDEDYGLWKYLATYTQYIPVGDHSVLKPRIRWIGSSRTALGAGDRFVSLADGRDSSNPFDRGTQTTIGKLGIRGYVTDNAFSARNVGIASLEYHFPFWSIFRGPGTLPAFIEQAHGFVFADGNYIQRVAGGERFLPSVGGGVSLDSRFFGYVPVKFNVEYQNGLKKGEFGDDSIFFSIESNGLF